MSINCTHEECRNSYECMLEYEPSWKGPLVFVWPPVRGKQDEIVQWWHSYVVYPQWRDQYTDDYADRIWGGLMVVGMTAAGRQA